MFGTDLHHLGRARTIAMASMNMRAVVTTAGRLIYLARPASNLGVAVVLARHQPRDERGRFIPYRTFGWASQVEIAASNGPSQG